jgi:nicotinamide riboside kinase
MDKVQKPSDAQDLVILLKQNKYWVSLMVTCLTSGKRRKTFLSPCKHKAEMYKLVLTNIKRNSKEMNILVDTGPLY